MSGCEGHHYCPNCDRSIDVASLEARVKELEEKNDRLDSHCHSVEQERDGLEFDLARAVELLEEARKWVDSGSWERNYQDFLATLKGDKGA